MNDTRRYVAPIDGLRALAVIVVVLHHAEIPGFERGFVGVDIFFAISGFLITQRLVTSLDSGTTQPLAEFWAGRARRILPAMSTVVVVTCAACALWLSPAEMERIAVYGVASNLFAVNLLAAWRGGNYFVGPLRDLPFLHLWSLGVEEQFYLIWPILVGVATRWVSGATRTTYRRAVVAVVAVSGVVSLACSVGLTPGQPLWAFYGPWARLYELALGAAAALFWTSRALAPSTANALRVGGSALIAASLVLTPTGVGFPSAWPLLSAGGATMLLVVAATADGSSAFEQVLGAAPCRIVGQASYGWYLWHWPAWVLTSTLVGRDAARVATVASILPAMVSQRLIENPIRFHPGLVGSVRKSAAAGLTASMIAVAASAGLWAWAKNRLDEPFMRELVAAQESFEPAGCEVVAHPGGFDVCVGGTRGASRKLLLLGDSHAAQWIAALSKAGAERDFEVVLSWAGLCPWAPLDGPTSERAPDCAEHRQNARALLSDPTFDAVLFADTSASRLELADVDEWEHAAEASLELASAPNRAVGVFVDNPSFGSLSWFTDSLPAADHLDEPLLVDSLQCVARGGGDADCAPRRSDAFAPVEAYAASTDAVTKRAGASVLDLSDLYCRQDPCELRTDDMWIPAGADHLSRDFTMRQRSRVADFVEELFEHAAG